MSRIAIIVNAAQNLRKNMIAKRLTNSFLLISFLLTLTLFSQKKATPTADELFRAFGNAFLERDVAAVKKLSIFRDNIDIISQLPKFTKEKLVEIKKSFAQLPIKWYLPGEIIKIHGSQITVNDVMVNDRKRIGTVRLLEMVYPIALRKLRTGEWKVDPFLMIQSINKGLEIERKKNRRNFRINLNGELIYLNEGEKVDFTDKAGKKHELSLFKNDIQHYKDGRVSFQYHRDMEVFPGKGKNCFVYTMNSDLSPEVHVLVYEKGAKLNEEMQRFINIWIENYKSKDAIFEEKMLKNTKQIINGKEYAGKIMYVKQQDKVYYNQFYFLEINGQVVGIFARSKTIDTGLLNQYLSILCEKVYPVKGK